MTHEELMELVRSMTAENYQEVATKIGEDTKEVFTTLDNSKQTISDMQEQISDLRDTNMKLFLRVNGDVKEEEEEEEKEPTIEDILKEMKQ